MQKQTFKRHWYFSSLKNNRWHQGGFNMNIRFYHARIITMADGMPAIMEHGELHVNGNKITFVGETALPKRDNVSWDREIDCENNLLLPGFKDAHTHSPMTFLRSYADDLPLDDWLHKQVFPAEAKLCPEDIYHFSKVAILEYLSGGITANFDMYAHYGANARASIDLGFRTVFCGSVNDFTGSVPGMEEEYIHFNHLNDRISYQLGFHAEYTTGRTVIRDIASLAQKLQAPVYMHSSETTKEVSDCIRRYGTTPTVFLYQEGIFAYGGGCFHMVHVTEEDLDICAKNGIFIITNPASNLKLASGIAPLVTMDEQHIPLAIGTDGPASNNCLDMFREMFLATALQKYQSRNAAALPAGRVLAMATTGGAAAMCLKDCDCLAAGKKADIIMLDMKQPNMQPENDIIKNIVYSGSKSNVKMTMIDGRILYENGKYFVGEPVEDIYAHAKECCEKIFTACGT